MNQRFKPALSPRAAPAPPAPAAPRCPWALPWVLPRSILTSAQVTWTGNHGKSASTSFAVRKAGSSKGGRTRKKEERRKKRRKASVLQPAKTPWVMQRNLWFLMPARRSGPDPRDSKSRNPSPTCALYLHFAKETQQNKFLQKLLISAGSKDM